jgi:hypothetical protein
MTPPTPTTSPRPATSPTAGAPAHDNVRRPPTPPQAPPSIQAAHADAKQRLGTAVHAQTQARETRRRLSFSTL